MSLPPFNFSTVFLIMVVWLLAGVLVGMLIGEVCRRADAADLAESEPDDDTWLDDAPTDVLSAAEIDRRIERFESELRHPSGREWLA